jgi:hypothetical protein
VLLYALTMAACSLWMIEMPGETATNFKELALVALGALGSLLARTSTGDGATPVTVKNTAANPVPTTDEADQRAAKGRRAPKAG